MPLAHCDVDHLSLTLARGIFESKFLRVPRREFIVKISRFAAQDTWILRRAYQIIERFKIHGSLILLLAVRVEVLDPNRLGIGQVGDGLGLTL